MIITTTHKTTTQNNSLIYKVYWQQTTNFLTCFGSLSVGITTKHNHLQALSTLAELEYFLLHQNTCVKKPACSYNCEVI